MDQVTKAAVKNQAPPDGLPGPTYTALTGAFAAALIPGEDYAIANDVAGRYLTAVVYPPTANATTSAIAAGRLAIARACTPITDGTAGPVIPDRVTFTAQ